MRSLEAASKATGDVSIKSDVAPRRPGISLGCQINPME